MEEETFLWDNLEGACTELVEDVATTLRYYSAQHGSGTPMRAGALGVPGARVERLLVCGAFSPIEEFIGLLRAKLYIDVAPWNPVDPMRCDAAEAAGACVRAARGWIVDGPGGRSGHETHLNWSLIRDS